MSDERHVIVIGSGHSGAMSALALLQQGIPVTMLESGEGRPDGGLLVRMMGMNIYRRKPELEPQHRVGEDNQELLWHQTFALGGLSHNWAGAVPVLLLATSTRVNASTKGFVGQYHTRTSYRTMSG